MKRKTQILMTTIVVGVALYDLFVVSTSGDIDASVSKWFASFRLYAVPVFCVGFLCSHFFIARKAKLPAGEKMTPRNFLITAALITATAYDVVMIQFYDAARSISSLPGIQRIGQYPAIVFPAGFLTGIFFGWMSDG